MIKKIINIYIMKCDCCINHFFYLHCISFKTKKTIKISHDKLRHPNYIDASNPSPSRTL